LTIASGLAPVCQTLAPGVVEVSPLLGREVLGTKVLTPSCVLLAGADGQVAPEEKHGASEQNRDAPEQKQGAPEQNIDAPEQNLAALNKKIGATTEIRIAPPKTFASLPSNHDASA
jgi:hypothetical protein